MAQRDQAAVVWFARSAKQGDEDAIKALQKLADRGVPEASAALRRMRLAP